MYTIQTRTVSKITKDTPSWTNNYLPWMLNLNVHIDNSPVCILIWRSIWLGFWKVLLQYGQPCGPAFFPSSPFAWVCMCSFSVLILLKVLLHSCKINIEIVKVIIKFMALCVCSKAESLISSSVVGISRTMLWVSLLLFTYIWCKLIK